jgi:hypothetical protein
VLRLVSAHEVGTSSGRFRPLSSHSFLLSWSAVHAPSRPLADVRASSEHLGGYAPNGDAGPRHSSDTARYFAVQRRENNFRVVSGVTKHDDAVLEVSIDNGPSRVEAG